MKAKLTVFVVLLNDLGDREEIYASGDTVDEAVEFAEEAIRNKTGDESFVMSDWRAA